MKRIWAVALLILTGCLVVGIATGQVANVILTWTAPGDDGNIGTAAKYDVRYSTTKPDTTTQTAKDAWWAAATVTTNPPTPLVAGSAQTMTVTPAGGFVVGQTYYFVIRTRDESGNWSDWSNVAWKAVTDVVPPAACNDLRAR